MNSMISKCLLHVLFVFWVLVFWVYVFWTEHYDIVFFIGCVWAIYLMSLFNIQMSEPEALKTIEKKM